MTAGTVIGTLGSPWRATVTAGGALVMADGTAPVDWWVAADDRWHTPAEEPSRRQRRLLGTPVVETAIGVPGGDVAQRIYAVADGGGVIVVVELENQSSLPVAVAFSRPDVASGRPLAAVPPGGPAGAAAAVPVGHRTTVRVVVGGGAPSSMPAAEQVARGWVAQTETGARYVVPDGGLMERIVTARCDALLAAPDPDDPVAFLLTIAERARLGEPPELWVDDVAAAAVTVAKRAARDGLAWDAAAALDAAAEVLRRAGEAPGAADVAAMLGRLESTGARPSEPPAGIRAIAWLAAGLVRATPAGADLLADFPAAWAGQSVEVYGASVQQATIGFALRWHGQRPALLWEASEAMRLTCSGLDPSWSATGARGDALLAPFSP
jgi:hypothetical protein